MLILFAFSILVLAILLLAGLYWRWQLRGLLLGCVFLITIIFAFASGLALVYGGSNTLPQAISSSYFSVGAIIGGGFFLVGVGISLLALETFRGPSSTISEIFSRVFPSKPRRGAEWQVIDGVVRQTRAADPGATESGRIIIPKNYAVIFEESSGKFSRTEFGPDVVMDRPNDKPTIVVATRPRFKRFSVPNLMAADGLVIDRVDFSLFYQLQRDKTLSGTANIQQPISEETLLKAVYGVAQWEDGKQSDAETWHTAVEEIAKNIVRAEFAKMSLVQLFHIKKPASGEVKQGDQSALMNQKGEVQPTSISERQKRQSDGANPRQEEPLCATQLLAERSMKSLNDSIGQWGAVINTLRIDYIGLRPQIQKRLEEQWMSERMEAIRQAEGKAEGEKIKEMEAAKGVAWKKLIGDMSDSLEKDQSLALKYIAIFEYLDSIARAPQSSSSTTARPVGDLLSLILGLEQKPRRFVEDLGEKGGATIIGDGPEESSSPGEEGKSGEAVI